VRTKPSYQQQLNSRARALDGRIELFTGWIYHASDGNRYMVTTMEELTALIKNLEEEAKNDYKQ